MITDFVKIRRYALDENAKRQEISCSCVKTQELASHTHSVGTFIGRYSLGHDRDRGGLLVMMEAGAVIGPNGNVIFWHSPNGRHGGALPDSRELWDVLWDNRVMLTGFAHSHPGGGVPGPSYTDVTTFAAVEAALGRRLTWWITSSDCTSVVQWCGPDKLSYGGVQVIPEPEWTEKLRELSEIRPQQK